MTPAGTSENNPENEEHMNTLFRAAHTFKGMAVTMGFKQIVELTHEMESLIDRLRARQIVLDSLLIDVLFVCVDALEGLVENAFEGEPNGAEKRKKVTDSNYESYPNVCEVLGTLRAINKSPKKTHIQKFEDKCLPVQVIGSETKEGKEKNCEITHSVIKNNEIEDNEGKNSIEYETSQNEEIDQVINIAKNICHIEKKEKLPIFETEF